MFLDFDGTLVPIRPRPEMVRMPRNCKRALARLARQRRATIWIISGRTRRDLRQRVGVAGLRYAGLHGWEREGISQGREFSRGALSQARELLKKRLAGYPGIRIEDKGVALAVHHRAATQLIARRAWEVVRRFRNGSRPPLRILPGKKVWELLPIENEGKGVAVHEMLAKLPSGTLPIYVGDDAGDEPALAALRRGITVRVGDHRNTSARYYVHGPQDVLRLLEALGREIE